MRFLRSAYAFKQLLFYARAEIFNDPLKKFLALLNAISALVIDDLNYKRDIVHDTAN